MLALFKDFVMEDYSSKTRQYEFFSESREVTTVRFSCFVGVDLHKTTVKGLSGCMDFGQHQSMSKPLSRLP